MPINDELLQEIEKFSDKKLSLKEWDLSDDDVEKLLPALQINPHIKELDLSLNYITNIGAKTLLTNLSNIEVLSLQGNDLDSEGLNELDLTNCKLKTLDISSNPIGDAVDVFANIQTLTELNASECDITDEGAAKLFESSSIEKLDLTTNNISGTSFVNLTNNTTLINLNLSQNDLLSQNLAFIKDNTTLSHLNLTSACIDDKGAGYLAQNKSLKELLLCQCFIGDRGAEFLSQNKTLEKLVLSGNNITEVGKQALDKSSSLIHINLRNNPCTKGMTYLSSLINKPKKEEVKVESPRRSSNSSNSSFENSLEPSPGHSDRSTPPKSPKNTLKTNLKYQ